MPSLKQTLSTLLVAAMLASPAAVAHAQLSAAQITAIDGKSGIRVFSSDGQYIGTTNGINIGQEQSRMFLRPLQGSILRRYGSNVDAIVTVLTDHMSLSGNHIVITDSAQRVKNKVNYSASDDPPQVKIFLVN